MVEMRYEETDIFHSTTLKIKDNSLKTKIKKQIKKIMDNPLVGKPMRNIRKGTREVYIKPFRLSYLYREEINTILFLSLYHKKKQ